MGPVAVLPPSLSFLDCSNIHPSPISPLPWSTPLSPPTPSSPTYNLNAFKQWRRLSLTIPDADIDEAIPSPPLTFDLRQKRTKVLGGAHGTPRESRKLVQIHGRQVDCMSSTESRRTLKTKREDILGSTCGTPRIGAALGVSWEDMKLAHGESFLEEEEGYEAEAEGENGAKREGSKGRRSTQARESILGSKAGTPKLASPAGQGCFRGFHKLGAPRRSRSSVRGMRVGYVGYTRASTWSAEQGVWEMALLGSLGAGALQ